MTRYSTLSDIKITQQCIMNVYGIAKFGRCFERQFVTSVRKKLKKLVAKNQNYTDLKRLISAVNIESRIRTSISVHVRSAFAFALLSCTRRKSSRNLYEVLLKKVNKSNKKWRGTRA